MGSRHLLSPALAQNGSLGPIPVDFHEMEQYFYMVNTTLHRFAYFSQDYELDPCQSYFLGASIPVSLSKLHLTTRLKSQLMHPVVPKFTELYQQAALAGRSACEWSVSLWHGMPTALERNKRFLN